MEIDNYFQMYFLPSEPLPLMRLKQYGSHANSFINRRLDFLGEMVLGVAVVMACDTNP